jgi:hypothetical protein
MRWCALLLLLAVLSLGFAPAPFPKSERPARESEQTRQERLLRACVRRLDELGVCWTLRVGSVGFSVQHPGGSGDLRGSVVAEDGGVASTLLRVVARVERYLGLTPRLKP